MAAPAEVPSGGSFQLREYISIARARKWSIAVAVAVTVAATLFYTARQVPIYQSEARVLVRPAGISSATGSGAVVDTQYINMETEMQLATSQEVAQFAADRLGEPSQAASLVGSVSADRVEETEILIFTYRSPDRNVPEARADAFALGYLDFRRSQLEEDLRAATQSLEGRIGAVRGQLKEAKKSLSRTDEDSFERPTLQARADSLIQQISVLEQQLRELTDPNALRVGDIVQSSSPPIALDPSPFRNGLLALIVGLALGMGAAMVRERLDDRMRDRADVEYHSGAPVLAAIPRVSSWRRHDGDRLVVLNEPDSIAAEAYRTLRTSVLFLSSQRDISRLMVTSPSPGEGKTMTTANLGVALAQQGKSVIMVCCDLRRPALHRVFGSHNLSGLTNVLAGEKKPLQALAWTGVEGLRLLSSGPIPGNPTELLSSDKMKAVLDELQQHADFILMDAAPVLPVADAMTLAPTAGGILLVADAKRTRRWPLEQARMQLDRVNGNVVGAVLNRFDPSQSRAPGHYYGYYRAPDEQTPRAIIEPAVARPRPAAGAQLPAE